MSGLASKNKFKTRILETEADVTFKKNPQTVHNANLKISLYACVLIKTILGKFCILNPKNYRVICP